MQTTFKTTRSSRSLLLSAILVVLIPNILSSCSFSNPEKLQAEGENFAKESIQEIGQNWDSQAYLRRADPSVAIAGDPTPLLKQFATLGPVKKIGKCHLESGNQMAGILINRPDFTGIYKCEVDCKSGPATISVGVIHKGDKWTLSLFDVYSELIKDLNKVQLTESKAYVESILPALCENMNVEFLRKHASSNLKAELEDKVVTTASGTMLATLSNGLGKFEKCDQLVANGYSLLQGQFVYSFTANTTFKNGKGTLSIGVVKEKDAWKLRAFNLKTHN